MAGIFDDQFNEDKSPASETAKRVRDELTELRRRLLNAPYNEREGMKARIAELEEQLKTLTQLGHPRGYFKSLIGIK